ncbi:MULTISPECIES: precorrin-2 C(20)-methyltransferase [Acetobacter]|uniref:Precorrin-2 C(20)-methyltransferase n=2 Tax=Acetobacter TaxID=434 RepID=A0A5B9GGS7_9PROT|nr:MULTISPECIES: precorrin-2 C(20)-methyltransferase [Acetobacter]GBR57906.1 precorrin-2 C20-methyltransferase [Acetobacter senegalensis DSM 18889]AKR49362.1 precorrin-2 C(20)-methyltransferase [Acetobacter pasteurianus]ARW48815.1 Precorrin-2 C(20)-methyltransferase [Acetobacter pasteurianus subsp. pasteurianus]MCP1203533.1 precorrin-2 C(20)-methyltransferase [Acetobacter oryzoeni]QEE85441.1 precorrin-2 C(20)-methyltransferase [Acetobacter oryzoeni]
MTRGTLQVVGVGPGDPELMTVRAVRLVQAAKVVAYFCRHDRPGHARTIARAHIAPDAEELRLEYPFTTEISVANPAYHGGMGQFYDECAHNLAQRLDKGQDVVLLCEGDPFLYGSAMYLFDRLKAGFETEVVPGIMAMNGCWTQAHLPITHGDDVLCVLPATLPEEKLTNWLEQADAAVIMKTGRNMPQVKRALEKAGRLSDAVYVERGTQENTRMCALQEQEDSVPYFSLVLLPGRKGVR